MAKPRFGRRCEHCEGPIDKLLSKTSTFDACSEACLVVLTQKERASDVGYHGQDEGLVWQLVERVARLERRVQELEDHPAGCSCTMCTG